MRIRLIYLWKHSNKSSDLMCESITHKYLINKLSLYVVSRVTCDNTALDDPNDVSKVWPRASSYNANLEFQPFNYVNKSLWTVIIPQQGSLIVQQSLTDRVIPGQGQPGRSHDRQEIPEVKVVTRKERSKEERGGERKWWDTHKTLRNDGVCGACADLLTRNNTLAQGENSANTGTSKRG